MPSQRDITCSVIPPHQLLVFPAGPSDLIVIQLDRAFFEATVREALGVAQPRLVERHAPSTRS